MQLEVLKATTETKEITYKVAYGLPLAEQFRWGLYVSNPRNFRETELPFPEPALFLLNPDGELQIVDYSNSPFARPDLRILVEGEFPCWPLNALAHYIITHNKCCTSDAE